MTEEKRFDLVCLYEEYGGQKVLTGKAELIDTNGELNGILENDIYVADMVDKLNEQHMKIQELEHWKDTAIITTNENHILWNELGIAREQGYKLSDAFEKYLRKLKEDLNDKLYFKEESENNG